MAKRLVWTGSDGSVSSFNPAPEAITAAGVTEDEFLADTNVRARVIPPGATNIAIVEKEDLPDRTFRAAWDRTGTAVTVNRAKAETIHRARIKFAADKKAEELAVEYIRADPTRKVEIESEAAALKTLDQDTDLSTANTLEDLDKVWPSELGARQQGARVQ